LKIARGDKTAAENRLAEGLSIARELHLPRLESGLVYEQVRLGAMAGQEIGPSLAQRVISHGEQALDGTGDITAEFREDSQIRLLLADEKASAVTAACHRARARRDHVDQRKRPRAHLWASLQLASCLATAGKSDAAEQVLAPALRSCAALRLSRMLIDEGQLLLDLAKDTMEAREFTSDDPGMSDSVREFVLSLTDPSTG
jgi:hypothetical protein